MRISLINLFVFRERQIKSERNVPFSETLDALHEEADTGDSLHSYCSRKVIISLKFQWISRTVMVKNNDIDEAMTILNKIMAQEGLTKRWRLTRTYEKPTWVSNA